MKNNKRKIIIVMSGILLISGWMEGQKNRLAEAETAPVSLKQKSISLNLETKKTTEIQVKKAKGVVIKKTTFSVKNTDIAAVTKKGKVTAKKEGSTKIVVSVKFQQKKKIKSKKLICSVVVEGKKEDSVQTNPPSWSKDDGVPHNTTEENEFQKILLRTNSNNEIGYEWENGHLKSLMVQIKTDGSAQEGTEKNESLTGGISGSLDMTVFPELRELYCGVNQITSLNVKNNAKLEKLECPGNRLTELDISQNTELKILYCGTNPIKSLDVANCPNLLQLWCMDNELTELDVSHNTKLQNFWCYNNSLQVLDVSQNLEVNDLRCDGNQIKSLDVSGHAMLRVLDCSDNQLEKLKLGQNAKLEYLTCDHNQLQVLDVSDCEKLVSIKYDEDKVVLNGWKN